MAPSKSGKAKAAAGAAVGKRRKTHAAKAKAKAGEAVAARASEDAAEEDGAEGDEDLNEEQDDAADETHGEQQKRKKARHNTEEVDFVKCDLCKEKSQACPNDRGLLAAHPDPLLIWSASLVWQISSAIRRPMTLLKSASQRTCYPTRLLFRFVSGNMLSRYGW